MHALSCSTFEYHLDVFALLLAGKLNGQTPLPGKKKKTKLKAISVSTVGNEWSREARAATQSPNGTENLILIFVFA